MNVGSDFGHVYSFLPGDEQTPTLTEVPAHRQLPRSIEGPVRPLSNMVPPQETASKSFQDKSMRGRRRRISISTHRHLEERGAAGDSVGGARGSP